MLYESVMKVCGEGGGGGDDLLWMLGKNMATKTR